MRAPVKVWAGVLLWFTCHYRAFLLAQTAFPHSYKFSSKSLKGWDEKDTATRGALQVQEVFLQRFSHILTNVTAKTSLESALDTVLTSPDHLPTIFSNAPPNTQPLLDPSTNSPTALRAIALARALADLINSNSKQSAAQTISLANITASLTQLSEQIFQLSPASCHPITRRIILAALVRLQLFLHSSNPTTANDPTTRASALRNDPKVNQLIFAIYRSLFNSHRAGAAVKGAIEFLHVSKSGGTSMCAVADRNGCRAESTSKYGNCMVRRFDDRPRWVSAAAHNITAPLDGWRWYYRYHIRRGVRSCEYRDEFMQRRRFTFYSNEFAAHGGLEPAILPPASGPSNTPGASSASVGANPASGPPWSSAHLCPQFLNVIMLREPLARLVSHVRWIIKVYRAEYGRRYEPFFRGRDADYWRRFAPAAVDNYYIRLLLGEAVFYEDTGMINATHLSVAKLVLLQYDVVLLLEASDLDELWMRYALGWRAGLSSARARVANHQRSTSDLAPFDMDELMAGNAEDQQLYDFATVLHHLDGLMFTAMAAARIQPYDSYDSINLDSPADEKKDRQFAHRVACGYVTRKKQLLTPALNSSVQLPPQVVNVTKYQRVYDQEFPRIPALDEGLWGSSTDTRNGTASTWRPQQRQDLVFQEPQYEAQQEKQQQQNQQHRQEWEYGPGRHGQHAQQGGQQQRPYDSRRRRSAHFSQRLQLRRQK